MMVFHGSTWYFHEKSFHYLSKGLFNDNYWHYYVISFISCNLVEHYISPLFMKEAIEFVVKNLIMLKVQILENISKELPLFIAKISLISFELDFEK
jgi:hypothetical protein